MTILLIGCGRMGGALARKWVETHDVAVFDPAGIEIVGARHLARLSDAEDLSRPLTVVVAVKPQVLDDVLAALAPVTGGDSLVISVVAGASIDRIRKGLSNKARIVRTMPNTPAAIGRGITAGFAGPDVSEEDRSDVSELFGAVGEVVWLGEERLMDAVTAVSGSGPAYFFRFAEAMAKAGADQGLDPNLAMQLARATLVGAGALAESREEGLDELRREVTSPGGTTAAALSCFDGDERLEKLVKEAVTTAANRARRLSC